MCPPRELQPDVGGLLVRGNPPEPSTAGQRSPLYQPLLKECCKHRANDGDAERPCRAHTGFTQLRRTASRADGSSGKLPVDPTVSTSVREASASSAGAGLPGAP